MRNTFLVGAPLALSVQCDAPESDTDDVNELTIELESAEPFAEALNNCRADRYTCYELCDQILVEYN